LAARGWWVLSFYWPTRKDICKKNVYANNIPKAGEMGIWNKLTVEVHMKELNDFKKLSALITLRNRFDVSVSLSIAYEMNHSGIETQTSLTNITYRITHPTRTRSSPGGRQKYWDTSLWKSIFKRLEKVLVLPNNFFLPLRLREPQHLHSI